MTEATLEHVNITSSEGRRTADLMCALFGWRIRWQGPAKDGGRTIHVGTDTAYLAIYTPAANAGTVREGRLNHIGVVVPDLDATEMRAVQAGYETYAHGDYEPGRRFYFRDHNGIEFEVVSYG